MTFQCDIKGVEGFHLENYVQSLIRRGGGPPQLTRAARDSISPQALSDSQSGAGFGSSFGMVVPPDKRNRHSSCPGQTQSEVEFGTERRGGQHKHQTSDKLAWLIHSCITCTDVVNYG